VSSSMRAMPDLWIRFATLPTGSHSWIGVRCGLDTDLSTVIVLSAQVDEVSSSVRGSPCT
jgi:hypothetical protein